MSGKNSVSIHCQDFFLPGRVKLGFSCFANNHAWSNARTDSVGATLLFISCFVSFGWSEFSCKIPLATAAGDEFSGCIGNLFSTPQIDIQSIFLPDAGNFQQTGS